MTLEEAKQEIGRLCDEYYKGYKGWDTKHPERQGDLSFMHISDGLEIALNILSGVDQ